MNGADSVRLSLSEWETFYVITGSSGAALTGLMFVVIALVAERIPITRPTPEMGAFSTPTVVHFTIVLLVAAVMTMPRETVLTLGVALALVAALGLIYTIVSTARMHRLQQYVPVADDWIWHIIFPFVAYAALFTAAIVLGSATEVALYMVAAVVLFLLVIGIHNAWDVAVYTITYRGASKPEATEPASAPEAESPPPRNP